MSVAECGGMRLLDIVLSLFKGTSKLDFGRLDPDDLEVYWRADHQIDQAERRGAAELAAALASWGLRDLDHWEKAKSGLLGRHGNNPEFKMAGLRVNFDIQLAHMSSSYEMPTQYIAPPHGVTLDRYASIKARLDLGQPVGSVLGAYQLDDHRWREVDGTWAGRMGPQSDAMAGNILRSIYGGMYQAATSVYGPA